MALTHAQQGRFMLDTVKLRSGYLKEPEAALIEAQMMRIERVNLLTGEVHQSLTRNWLPGSYSERLSVRVERTEIRTDDTRTRASR